jgi:hypothetical protein
MKTINLPDSAGFCAWDADECWVMVAVDSVEEMNAVIDQLKPRHRIRLRPNPVVNRREHEQANRTARGRANCTTSRPAFLLVWRLGTLLQQRRASAKTYGVRQLPERTHHRYDRRLTDERTGSRSARNDRL